jgi:hypothetical protein
MLPDVILPLPASLASLLAVFRPLFTAPSFRTFTALACGFLSQAGKRTVCGMLAGAGLSWLWPHDRAHRFFARARRSADDLGLAVAKLVIKDTNSASRLRLARRMAESLAGRWPAGTSA